MLLAPLTRNGLLPTLLVFAQTDVVPPSRDWVNLLAAPVLVAVIAGLLSFFGARAAFRRELRGRRADVRLEERRRAAQSIAAGVYDFFAIEHDLMTKAPDARVVDRWDEKSNKLLELRRHIYNMPQPWAGVLLEVVEILYAYDDVARSTNAYSPYGVLSVVHSWTEQVVAAFLDLQKEPPEPPDAMWVVRVGLSEARELGALQNEAPDRKAAAIKSEKALARAKALRDSGTWRLPKT